jgi:hypothetical protein
LPWLMTWKEQPARRLITLALLNSLRSKCTTPTCCRA